MRSTRPRNEAVLAGSRGARAADLQDELESPQQRRTPEGLEVPEGTPVVRADYGDQKQPADPNQAQ